jgi:hypothetical protein
MCHSPFKDSSDINLSWFPDGDGVTGIEAATAAPRDAIPKVAFLRLSGMFTYFQKKTNWLCHADPSVSMYHCDFHCMDFHEI